MCLVPFGTVSCFRACRGSPHGCHAARCSSFYSMPVPYPSSPAPSPAAALMRSTCSTVGALSTSHRSDSGHSVCWWHHQHTALILRSSDMPRWARSISRIRAFHGSMTLFVAGTGPANATAGSAKHKPDSSAHVPERDVSPSSAAPSSRSLILERSGMG